MPRARAFALLAVAALVLWHCSNGATGVEACRNIEQKKCELLVGCPNLQNPIDEDHVNACKLFYRDECLLGMFNSVDPNDAETNECLAALDAAATCKGVKIDACQGAPKLSAIAPAPGTMQGCDLLIAPQNLQGCAFLVSPSDTSGKGGAGGTGGATGAGGTTSGQGGTTTVTTTGGTTTTGQGGTTTTGTTAVTTTGQGGATASSSSTGGQGGA